MEMLESKKAINNYRRNEAQVGRSPRLERRKRNEFEDYNAVLHNLNKLKKIDYLKERMAKHQP